jgi:transcriptional regulator GlxA family with amidase domain
VERSKRFFRQFALPSPSHGGDDSHDHQPPPDDGWRQTHLGRLLGHAMRRFDERVLHLMAHNVDVPLALSNLAARAQVSAAHVHITRHLSVEGARASPTWPTAPA